MTTRAFLKSLVGAVAAPFALAQTKDFNVISRVVDSKTIIRSISIHDDDYDTRRISYRVFLDGEDITFATWATDEYADGTLVAHCYRQRYGMPFLLPDGTVAKETRSGHGYVVATPRERA